VVESFLRDVLGGADPPAIERLVANDHLRQRVADARGAFPDLRVTVDLIFACDQMVGARLSGRGTHGGQFLGVEATGKEVTLTGTVLYQVEDGKIVDYWANWDWLAILDQLGAVEVRQPPG
jgi:predicted ester cyclase